MQEHIKVGREYPSIDLNTSYSFGLDDQEFVVAFEGDDPAVFLDLVQRLRTTEASAYTKRDTPTFTCVADARSSARSTRSTAPRSRSSSGMTTALRARLRRDPRHHGDRRRPGRPVDRLLGRDAPGERARIIDSLPEIGGQCTTLYPEKWIFDVPGHPKVLAKDLVAQLREQALEQFDVPVHLETTANDDLLGRRRRHAAHRPRRPALAHGDRRRRPRRVRAQEAAGLRRRHGPVGGPRRPLPRRREDGVRRQARRHRRRRRLGVRLGRQPASTPPRRSRSCTAATASAPTRRRSPRSWTTSTPAASSCGSPT